MNTLSEYKQEVADNGFCIINEVYSNDEVEAIIAIINKTNSSNDTFRKSADLFAIRQFLKEVPESYKLLFNKNLRSIVKQVFGDKFFVVKSIFFDKPPSSNWYVSYHQDLTISVDKKVELKDFGPWTVKQNQFAVQPSIDILENIFTIRIHLDNTNEENGALKVIPGSHLKGIYRPEKIDWNKDAEVNCSVSRGGVMIMKPLLLHSSVRTINNQRRRVIHIEFSSLELPEKINWSERMN